MRSTLLFLCLLVAFACNSQRTGTKLRAPAYDRLATLIEQNDLEPIIPPETHYGPGTIVESSVPLSAATRIAEPSDVFPDHIPLSDPSSAAWLTEEEVTGGLDLGLGFVAGQEGASLLAKLQQQGTRSSRLRFGPARIDRISQVKIDAQYSGFSPRVQEALRSGHAMVLEALVVEWIEIAFLDASERVVDVSVELMAMALDVGGRARRSERVAGAVVAEGPFVVGIKRRAIRRPTSPPRTPDPSSAGPTHPEVRPGPVDGPSTLRTVPETRPPIQYRIALPGHLEPRRAELIHGGGLVTINADREPNDSAAQASVIDRNAVITGRVDYANDREDWYAFFVPSDGISSVTIENTSPRGTRGAGLGATRLLEADGQRQRARLQSRSPGQSGRVKDVTVSAGSWYFIQVSAQRARGLDHSATYRLSLSVR